MSHLLPDQLTPETAWLRGSGPAPRVRGRPTRRSGCSVPWLLRIGASRARIPCVEEAIGYARSDDVNIAYQVTGEGAFDLVLVSGFVSHLDEDWQHPSSARLLERLGSFARLIRFDKRGTGLSDRAVGLPDFETRMDDVRAVMDAVGSQRAALFGYSEGGPLAVLFAATYPQRVRALALYGTYAKRSEPNDDYPWCETAEERADYAAAVEREWGVEADLTRMAPSADESFARWWMARARAAASPGSARDLVVMNSQADIRDVLPAVQAPTLVIHRVGDRDARVEEGRYIAANIPGARFVELPGDTHVPFWQPDDVIDEVEEYFTGLRPTRVADRVLATILFTDLVGSTERVGELGDHAWAELLERHHQLVRRELRGSAAKRSIPQATDFSRCSTDPRGQFVARSRSTTVSPNSASMCARAFTPERSSGRAAARRAGSRYTRVHGSLPQEPPATFWCR
jgi:pimeloyl-ACP methyl ester carboxylesterase